MILIGVINSFDDLVSIKKYFYHRKTIIKLENYDRTIILSHTDFYCGCNFQEN